MARLQAFFYSLKEWQFDSFDYEVKEHVVDDSYRELISHIYLPSWPRPNDPVVRVRLEKGIFGGWRTFELTICCVNGDKLECRVEDNAMALEVIPKNRHGDQLEIRLIERLLRREMARSL